MGLAQDKFDPESWKEQQEAYQRQEDTENRVAAIITTVTFSIYTVIFVLALWKVARRSKWRPSNAFSRHRESVVRGDRSLSQAVLIIVTIVMYGLTVVNVAFSWQRKNSSYDTGRGPSPREAWNPAENIIQITTESVIFLADCTVLWRLWIVFGQEVRLLLVIPALGLLAEFVMLCMVERFVRNEPYFRGAAINLIVFPLMSLFTTAYCTIAIILRISRHSRLLGTSGLSSMSKVLEIVVESALLYSIALLAHSIVALLDRYLLYTTNYMYTYGVVACAAGLCPTLILARVMQGSSRDGKCHSDSDTLNLTTATKEYKYLDTDESELGHS
ncbi:hypothetical protein CYLTODRAFT_494654 [Cylindrobasidium torrendii FP15055 ss-10]|uniref:G-protein coupled receptors family 1 profile domain-containing protein n=1 Tax=Cylindrobasidium torrendii FP15055 ss-10 TaxID=1314674 RepID=A0A0D7AWP1_9AGAR|nr:hypothetical protein CYLTODRAFT_494654 [Cylindrobasidium torrendii FP15055 ss-10]